MCLPLKFLVTAQYEIILYDREYKTDGRMLFHLNIVEYYICMILTLYERFLFKLF